VLCIKLFLSCLDVIWCLRTFYYLFFVLYLVFSTLVSPTLWDKVSFKFGGRFVSFCCLFDLLSLIHIVLIVGA